MHLFIKQIDSQAQKISTCLLSDSGMSFLQLRGSSAGLHNKYLATLKHIHTQAPDQLNKNLWESDLGIGGFKSSPTESKVQPGNDSHHFRQWRNCQPRKHCYEIIEKKKLYIYRFLSSISGTELLNSYNFFLKEKSTGVFFVLIFGLQP